jgi:hypothetical protein
MIFYRQLGMLVLEVCHQHHQHHHHHQQQQQQQQYRACVADAIVLQRGMSLPTTTSAGARQAHAVHLLLYLCRPSLPACLMKMFGCC